MKIILIALLFPLFAFAAEDQFHIKKLDKENIEYRGSIRKGRSYQELMRYLDSDIKVLNITSEGGDSTEALRMAMEITKRNIHVVVDGYCFSACANYLFIGAKSKSLKSGALLGFHGNAGRFLIGNKKLALEQVILDAKLDTPEKKSAADSLNPVERVALLELYFFNKFSIPIQFFEVSHQRITAAAIKFKKTDIVTGKIVLTADDNNETWDFALDQEAAYEEKVKELHSQGRTARFTKTIKEKEVHPKIGYFPSLATLEKNGITGISKYFYPANEGDFQKLLITNFGSDFLGVHDFETKEMKEEK